MTQASCLCGAVRYEIAAPFTMMAHCHCSMCRKHHGAPFATFAGAPFDAFHWLAGEDALGKYDSSEQGSRSFCTTCGSVGPLLMADAGFAIVPAGNLSDDPGIRPQNHMFTGSKAPWYTITDSLPQHEGFPAEYGGGTGIERPAAATREDVIAGSCLCGEVAYELDAPLRMVNCHCSRCRRGRSAAHTTNLFAKADDFRWTRGEALLADYKVPEARYFGVAFCTRCGGEAPRASPGRGIVVIPAGTLDTDPGMRPQMHIFVGSKAPWFEITDDLPQFAEMPES
jgi:hypothetical protein